MTVAFLSLSSLRQFYFFFSEELLVCVVVASTGNWRRRKFNSFLGPGRPTRVM